LGKRRTVEEVHGGDNSTNSKDIDPAKRAIHIHGGMERNLAEHAKYSSYGNIEISKGSEFTKETYCNKRYFSRHW
jgi:hypothetical protein